MASLIGKAMSNEAKQNKQLTEETKAELQKLEGEFSSELQSLGVKVANLEKTASTLKIGAAVRIRYQENPVLAATNKDSTTPSRAQERFSINMTGNVIPNVTFYGDMVQELKSENRAVNGATNSEIATTSGSQYFTFDRAEFLWKNANYSLNFGRSYITLGNGLIWSGGIGNPLDGIYGKYNFNKKLALTAGYADLDGSFATGKSVNARISNLQYNVTSNASITVANLKVLNNPTLTYGTQMAAPYNTGTVVYNFDQTGVSSKVVSGDWTFYAEAIRNNAPNLPGNAQRNGQDVKIQWKNTDPNIVGSYSAALEYMHLGNWATDSVWWKVNLFIPGGNYIGGDGAKGFGLDTHYTITKNVDVSLKYYRLKPYDCNVSSFSSYKPFFAFSTNWIL